MAAGAWVVPDLAKLNLVNATDILAATAANFRLALVKSTWTPNNATDELWAAASANELANGNGYTTGGIVPSVEASVLWSMAGDETPSAVLSGAATVSGSNPAHVLQRVQGGVDLTDYALRCTALSAEGDVLVVAAVLPVRQLP